MTTTHPPRNTIPHKLVDLNRAVARRAVDTATGVVRTLADGAGRIIDASRTAGRTVAGQAEAQGAAVADTVVHETERIVDRGRDAVDPMPGRGTPYEQWTRAELYERAQELEIEGRATMSKAELIAALRNR